MVLRDESYSEFEISINVGSSKTTTHTAIINFQKSGTFSDNEGSGPPRKTICKDD